MKPIFKSGKAKLKNIFSVALCFAVLAGSMPLTLVSYAANGDIPSEETLKANRIITTTPINTKFNLFDYWVYGEQNDNDWIISIKRADTYKNGFNAGHPLIVGNGMGGYAPNYDNGLYNTASSNWGGTYANNKSYIESIVDRHLGADGMPQLNVPDNPYDLVNNGFLAKKVYNAWQANGGDKSLGYMFNPYVNVPGKASYKNIKNLFKLDGGNYSFHSSSNFAELVEYPEDEKAYDSDGYFNVYNTWGIKHGSANRGTFSPFNKATQAFREGATSSSIKQSGITSVQNQGQNTVYTSTANNLGTTNATTTVNHYMGATMETSFIQPTNGTVVNGDVSSPMSFSFSGDNDVWIFIDGILVGDLGGMHSESYVVIDFQSGNIYRGAIGKDGTLPTIDQIKNDSLPSGATLVSTTTIKEMHELAGDTTQDWNGNTYADSTVHTLNFFFLERGGWDTNLSLDFNLVSVPHSSIIKVDQDNDPIEGATFELYAGIYNEETGETTINPDYNEGKPICVSTTNSSGQVILVNEKRQIIRPDALAGDGVTAYVLRETVTPYGYRSIDDAGLYYQNGLILSRDYITNGVYATPKLTVTLPLKQISDFDDPTKIIDDYETKGIVFAVPLKKSADVEKFDVYNEATLHAVYGTYENGWTVMSEGSDLSVAEQKEALVYAAKHYNCVASKNARNLLALEITETPGRVQKSFWYNYTYANKLYNSDKAQVDQYVADNTEYVYAFYYAPVKDISLLTENTEIMRIDDTSSEKQFSAELHVPNTFNRFRVQKLDYKGNRVTGAKFGLFQLFSYTDRDGDGEKYMQTEYLNKKVYMNTDMFNLTPADYESLRAGNSTATSLDLVAKMKTRNEVCEQYQNGSLKAWDVGTTDNTSITFGLNFEGTCLFPTAYQHFDESTGVKPPVVPSDTSTYVEKGYYIVYELEPPPHYVANENPVRIEVADDQIYASAGTGDDGIRVGMFVGWPLGSISAYAKDDATDATFTYIKANLKKASNEHIDGVWQATYADIDEGLTTYRYKYDNAKSSYQRYYEEDGTAVYLNTLRNMTLFTETGFPMLQIFQDTDKTPYTLTLKREWINKSGKLTLYLDKDGTKSKYTVNVTNGRASYRLEDGQTIDSYELRLYDANKELQSPITLANGDYYIDKPEVVNANGADISKLFSATTVAQVYDHDQGNLKISKEVESGPVTETDPFYFRLYGIVDNVTEIQLFNPDGTPNTTYTGPLNVRIGPIMTLEQLEKFKNGEYPEDGCAVVTADFTNGVAKLHMTGKNMIREVIMPENPDHGAYGLEARTKCEIDLEDTSFNGTLSVHSYHPTTGVENTPQDVEFKNGVGYCFIPRETKLTKVIDGSGKEYAFDASTRCNTATSEEIYDESPITKLPVTFAGGDNIMLTDTDVTLEADNQYYLHGRYSNAKPTNTETTTFLGENAFVADFALYPGQSIDISSLPCGLTAFVEELAQASNDVAGEDVLKTLYQTTAEYTSTPTGAPAHEEVLVEEYVAEYRCFKTMVRSSQDGHITFTNKAYSGDLAVEKTVSGTALGHENDPNYYFTFEISFTSDLQHQVLAGGTVSYIDSLEPSKVKTAKLDKNGKMQIDIKPNQKITLVDIPDNIKYTVSEISATDYGGWDLEDYKTNITTKKLIKSTQEEQTISTVTSHEERRTADGVIDTDTLITTHFDNVRDNPDFLLPYAGSLSIYAYLYIIVGLILFTGAFAYLSRRYRE